MTFAKSFNVKNVTVLVFLALLLLAVGVGREPDLTDECFLLYEAQAAWNVGGQDLGSSPATKMFGYLLGLPFLVSPDAGLLTLRLFSSAVWLVAFAALAWSLRPAGSMRSLWGLPLLFLLHSFYLPLLNYQSFPAVVLALLFACWFQVKTSRVPGVFLFLTGVFCGLLPLCHVPLLAPTLLLALWLILRAGKLEDRVLVLVGFLLTFGVFFTLWQLHHGQVQDRNRWLTHVLLPELAVADAVEPVLPELRGYVARVHGSLVTYGARIFNGGLMVLLCFVAGYICRGPIVRRLRDARVKTHRGGEVALWIAALVFLILWFSGVRSSRTICGLFTLVLLWYLPVHFFWMRTESLPTRALRILTGTVLVFASCHSLAGSLNTVTDYPMFYMPLVWIPVVLSILQISRTPATNRFLTQTAVILALLNCTVLLTHGHRAASVVEGPRIASRHAPFQGLYFRPEREMLLQETISRFEEGNRANQCVVGMNHLSYPYVLLQSPAPWGNAFFYGVHSGLEFQVRQRVRRELFLLTRTAEGVGFRGELVAGLFGEERCKSEVLADGVWLSRSASGEMPPVETP